MSLLNFRIITSSSMIILFCLLLLCRTTLAVVDIVDGTKTFVKSSESTFDHEVLLFEEESESITFHWNDIKGNTLEGRLIHKSPSIDKAPSWIGFGIYDTFKNTEPITSTSKLMIGSEALIGIVKEKKVEKYNLNDKAVSSVVPSDHQTLLQSNIVQHNADDGTVTTDLTFEKLIEENDTDEIRIRHVGTNVFLWAIGPSGTDIFGYHNRRGAFTVDLETVMKGAQQGLEGSTIDQITDTNFDSDASSSSTGGSSSDSKNTSPVVKGQCASSLPETEMMVRLTPTFSFHWTVNANASPPSVTIAVEYDGNAWLGLGFSEHGKMIGSTAVIGKPNEGSVEKYDLADKSISAVIPSKSQTLQDTSIEQSEGKTKLTFTKLLNENNDEEVVLTQKGLNTFVFAVGSSNEFGYHEHRGSFRLDLSACSADVETGASGGNMAAWATHGTFAVLAWAIASPFAITVAWFRTLVPSSWIYIHVFANVVSFMCSLVAVIVAVTTMSYDPNPHHFEHPHHWLGLILIVAMTFQVMNGFLRPPVEKRDPYAASQYDNNNAIVKIPRSPREVWWFSHKSTGIVMLAIAVFQINSGLKLFSEKFNTNNMAPWYWLYIGLFGSGLIALKLWIMFEEYKARRGMEAINAVPQGGRAGENDPLPVQYETS